jgi:hypothetical protein
MVYYLSMRRALDEKWVTPTFLIVVRRRRHRATEL